MYKVSDDNVAAIRLAQRRACKQRKCGCRGLMVNCGACLPAMKVRVEHHIDTEEATTIMLKRSRQAQTEDS
ncbi:hypothetical protein PHMEG_0003407 [Phytophthora megakarya]|uniref:Uncharacterized protein n=1 Tax=Phytophthora megakarya TaxID=4795 RepID=A0A225WWP4_9STRA|nr:hypothetical protein PHMEG_0003407 [Phytophthora megakarya]